MTSAEFVAKYKLFKPIAERGARSFLAQEVQGQRAVLVHRLDIATPDENRLLLGGLNALRPEEWTSVIEVTDVDGVAVVVTRFTPDFHDLPSWIAQRGRPSFAAPRPDPTPSPPPLPGGFAGGFSGVGLADAPPPAQAASPQAGEFTQLFGAPIGRSAAEPFAPPLGPPPSFGPLGAPNTPPPGGLPPLPPPSFDGGPPLIGPSGPPVFAEMPQPAMPPVSPPLGSGPVFGGLPAATPPSAFPPSAFPPSAFPPSAFPPSAFPPSAVAGSAPVGAGSAGASEFTRMIGAIAPPSGPAVPPPLPVAPPAPPPSAAGGQPGGGPDIKAYVLLILGFNFLLIAGATVILYFLLRR